MAQKVFQGLYDDILAGEFNSSADCYVMLVMSDTTVAAEIDAQTFADFTTVDECDGAGYAQLQLQSLAMVYDSTDDRLEVDAEDGDVDGGAGVISASTRPVVGYIIYRYVDGMGVDDVPWVYRDIGPYTPAGGSFDFIWNSEGILLIASA